MDELSTTGETPAPVHAVLYRRERLPPPIAARASAVEQQLKAMADDTEVDSVEFRTWCSREPLGDCAEPLKEAYIEFEGWARETGRSLTPFFSIRECYKTGKLDRDDWLVAPTLCLAIYEGETVRAVYPHRKDGNYWAVEDGLDYLRPEEDATPSGGHSTEPDESAVIAD